MLICPIKQDKKACPKYFFTRKVPKGLKFLVKKGDNVKRDSVLASGDVLDEKVRLDLSKELDTKPQDAARYLLCLNGEMIKKGDIIAHKRGGMIKKEIKIRATSSGVLSLDEIESGFIKILGTSKEDMIYSGIEGEVVSAIKDRHIKILAKVLRYKPFLVRGKSVDGEIFFVKDKKDLGPNLSDGIVVCDFELDEIFLRDLALNRVACVITGGVDYNLLQKVKTEDFWGLTIVATEGFGNFKIKKETFGILQKNDGYVCLVDSHKKEIIFTNLSDGVSFSKRLVGVLNIGDDVCIYNSSFFGVYGIVEQIGEGYAKVTISKKGGEQSVNVNIFNLVKISKSGSKNTGTEQTKKSKQ